ncbi:ankyrin repeat domain-containing protein [Qipengyuania gaetbuli]|uniref:ankyrin repeat domain-containing protein n=1 Tax=Qipengyuania gaetbuli TaxID=266952 RepID=UPI001CD61241|nr:ankyrin repeat domain-containing protein [Qipengyuania gaetbuli]MCA0910654.1 ankyrin repeat domain-containing protein [Qipengyuania gaetbuli]
MRVNPVSRFLALAFGMVALVATPVAAQQRSDGSKFLEAVRKRDGDTATQLLDEPGSTIINARDITTGETGLHAVAERRDLTWVRFLLQRGANPNIADRNGVTPLQIAAQLGFVEGVERLAQGGADVDVRNVAGETPLISAIHRRDVAMIEVLIKAGANLDRTDNSGRTARDYAKLMGEGSKVMGAITAAEEARGKQAETYGPN